MPDQITEDTAAEILNFEITQTAVRRARQFVESFAYTTSALIAIEAALREQYADAQAEGLIPDDAPAITADLLAGIIRAVAAQEATEV